MLRKRLTRFVNRPDVRQNPTKAVLKRLLWRLHWSIKRQPYVVPFAETLKISLPKTGSGSLVYYQGFSEPETADFFLRFLRPGMVLLDIGAHIGEYTLLGVKIIGETGQVHAFEPQPQLFSVLTETVRLNQLENIILNCTAVSDRPGEVEFEMMDELSVSSIRRQKDSRTSANIMKVFATSIDTYWANQSRKVDLIKVDVEGAEKFVFQGATELMRLPSDKAPTWIFEYAPKSYDSFNYQPQELLQLLHQNGYDVWRYSMGGQLQDFDPNFPPLGIANLIASKDKTHLLSLLNRVDEAVAFSS